MEEYTMIEVILGLIIILLATMVPLYHLIKNGRDYSPIELILNLLSLASITLVIFS
jgi:hypothetical protein